MVLQPLLLMEAQKKQIQSAILVRERHIGYDIAHIQNLIRSLEKRIDLRACINAWLLAMDLS